MKNLLLCFLLLSLPLGIKSQSVYEIQGQQNASPYLGQVVSTQGMVTAVFPGSYFVQDGDSAWCGVYVYDTQNNPQAGDSISFTAEVSEYYSLTELKSVSNYVTRSTGNPLPEPILLSTGEANDEKWEGVYIRVEHALCTNPALGYGEWAIDDGSGTLVVEDMGVAYVPTKDVPYHITGPLTYTYSKYKIAPPSEGDIFMDIPLYMTENPKASEITYSGFDVRFTTNDSAIAVIEYGYDTRYSDGILKSRSVDVNHTLSLDRLDAGTIYFAKIYAVNAENDTTPTFEGAFVTRSYSSGQMNVTFVKPSVLNKPNTIVDTLVHYVGLATNTLDIAIYDLTNHAAISDDTNYRLIDAINKAYDKGVKIRLVTDDAVDNVQLDSLNAGIPVLRGNANGIMHHKFLVIDKMSVKNSWVVAGSTNWTYNNLMMDFNNLVAIQDQSLAKAYGVEFEEMWGSSTMAFNENNSRFGADKIDNTPHRFVVGGKEVALYFSPSDKTESYIKEALDSAKTSIDFVQMLITRSNLAESIIDAHESGLRTIGVIDYVDYDTTTFNKMVDAGVDVVDFVNANDSGWPDNPTCHHKYVVIDAQGENPLTITGTHNWSYSAESKNDENTLFIYDADIAALYVDELKLIRDYMGAPLETSISKEILSKVKIVPNPSGGVFEVQNINRAYSYLDVYDAQGRLIIQRRLSSESLRIQLTKNGLYFVKLWCDSKSEVQKVLIRQ